MAKNDIINPTNERVDEMSDYQYKYNKKSVEYNMQYVRDHYDTYTLKMPAGMKDKIKEKAQHENLSVNKYIIKLIEEGLG